MEFTRHGDVLLAPARLPDTARLLSANQCKCKEFAPCAMHAVFAHGEVSGHVHQAVGGNVAFYEDGGTLYAQNTGTEPAHLVQSHGLATLADIAHLEKCYKTEGLHAPIKEAIPAGATVKVVFPQEYDWVNDEIQRARD